MKYILEYNNFINESTMTKTDFIKIAKNKWNNLYLYNRTWIAIIRSFSFSLLVVFGTNITDNINNCNIYYNWKCY